MKKNKIGQVTLLSLLTALLSSCQGVSHLFKAHLVVCIIIIAFIVILITGIIIKLSAKVPE